MLLVIASSLEDPLIEVVQPKPEAGTSEHTEEGTAVAPVMG